MPGFEGEEVWYRRNRFRARLPAHYLYLRSHFWLHEDGPGSWRIGLTNFATRMLGEIVEFEFERRPGDAVRLGEAIGWIEGFKAVSDLYCVAEGRFAAVNEAAREDTEVISRDPYRRGWLYAVEGSADPEAVDVQGYVEHLNRTIDRLLEQPWSRPLEPEGP